MLRIFKILTSKIKVTKLKPNKKTDVGKKYTLQQYADGTVTLGERTGVKKGPHYRGKGELS